MTATERLRQELDQVAALAGRLPEPAAAAVLGTGAVAHLLSVLRWAQFLTEPVKVELDVPKLAASVSKWFRARRKRA